MNIEEYIEKNYTNNLTWFEDEVNQSYHSKRIADAIRKVDYLNGIHTVKNREDAVYKGRELITRKTIIQYAKTILDFHSNYLVGKPISLTGGENTVNILNEIYKLRDEKYSNNLTIDYKIVDKVNKFGDAYEVVYADDEGVIRSKVLNNADCYPVYSELGEYLAFIEHWTDGYTSVCYYNVYYPTYVERWTNDGGELHMYDSAINVFGLPIHYHNFSNDNDLFGESMLDDIIPLLDELEDVYSKLGDGIYVNVLNPMPVSTGVRLDSSIPADATGYVLNMENGGDFKVVSTTMDCNTIKFYIESLKTMINEIACIPAVLSNSEVANISEMSMKMLFHLASIKATISEKWMTLGLQERFKRWRSVLAMQGMSADEEVEVIYNLSMPIDTKEVYENLEKLYNMGAISKRSIMEISEVVKDADVEMKRIEEESKKEQESKGIEDNGEDVGTDKDKEDEK